MHTATCWTGSGYQYCNENEICCNSGIYEHCCWDTVDSGAGVGLVLIMASVGSFVFVMFVTLLVIKCVCSKNRGHPGRVTGRVRRVLSNRTHPAVHVNPPYPTVPPAAAVRGHVPGGQVFVSPPTKSPQLDQRWPGPPPPYPGSPLTHTTHNAGATNQSQQYQGHTQPHPPYPPRNHPAPLYPPHEPAKHSAPPLGFEQMVPATPRERAPPHGAHGNVPPPFEYIPPMSVLYK